MMAWYLAVRELNYAIVIIIELCLKNLISLKLSHKLDKDKMLYE